MSDLLDIALKERYKQYYGYDSLEFAKDEIDWSAFPQHLRDLYHKYTDTCGKHKLPIITMVKVF